MEAGGLRELLAASHEAARWDDVASRCLTCGNCTMACPTCFCTTVEDVTDLSGDHAERWQSWASCFELDFSRLHGGPVRASGVSRYRQWLTHKLGTWHDQFGSSGCVGCGRCIVWCPVGIDLTEEVAALRDELGPQPAGTNERGDPQ
jgi:sulfhydrogenase subunit beta (sulfur reductase)